MQSNLYTIQTLHCTTLHYHQAVASVDYAVTPEEVMEKERGVFGQRWGSKDNQQALKDTNSSRR